MIVYVIVGEYERSLMSTVLGAFNSEEKAVECIHNVFENAKYNADYDTWTAPTFHDSIELRIVKLEVQ